MVSNQRCGVFFSRPPFLASLWCFLSFFSSVNHTLTCEGA